jgi:transposase
MLKLDLSRWEHPVEDLRQLALTSDHPRTRERWMALYEIATGKNATVVGKKTGRNPQTVMEWVHRYNEQGPLALVFEQTGGHSPLCLPWLN